MARALWKGHISFGLVQIPVGLRTAVESDDLSFNMLDSRDMARVGYERVNKETGEPVPWEEVVKGYEVAKGEYVVLGEQDFEAADVQATQTVDIVKFVDGATIDATYYDKPYYLEPTKKGHKPYALLRETLRESGMVGIAKVVIRKRQHLAALLVRDDVLILELMRFHYEIRDWKDLDLPSGDAKKLGVKPAELKMAKQLVEGMAGEWDPTEYSDEYRDDLMALIETKADRGEVNVVGEPEEIEHARPVSTRSADIMALLKQSVEGRGAPRRKTAGGRTRAAARTARAKTGTKKKSKSKRKTAKKSKKKKR